ncbi:hypothetical protein YH65_10235 [Sulfurovum lithotrophicum]|uniref:Sulfotransferase n=1 Tax=Sulfurovum lithotrophicum TaxID=206403 RepID=A0A7U4RRF2_9BACT|nr:sulfotransferase family 2 domain-containing protein [Sulfurovum lithotrophicum]AKF25721.1 hypothetical protein YH65_10235 [Sulfurovum lithotrophicum]
MQKKILFFHVPKTAGSSFRYALEKIIPKEKIFYDYGILNDLTKPVIKQWCKGEIKTTHFEKVIEKRDIMLYGGHITHMRYQNFLPAFKRVTFIRDPLQRAYSEYNHRKGRGDFEISFEEFIERPQFINTLHKVFGSAENLKDLDFIGFTEYYQESIELFNKQFGYDIKVIVANVRRNSLDDQHHVSQATIERFQTLNKDDIDLYNSLLEVFKKRITTNQNID